MLCWLQKWHRDIAAAFQILRVGLHALFGLPRPAALRWQTRQNVDSEDELDRIQEQEQEQVAERLDTTDGTDSEG